MQTLELEGEMLDFIRKEWRSKESSTYKDDR